MVKDGQGWLFNLNFISTSISKLFPCYFFLRNFFFEVLQAGGLEIEHFRDIERFWLVLPSFLWVRGTTLSASKDPQTSFGRFWKRTRGRVLSALANTGNEATLATDTVYAMISAAWSKAPKCLETGSNVAFCLRHKKNHVDGK